MYKYNQGEDDMKKLSIIIPTYNRSIFLKQAIQSILKQDISQDDIEIIVIDDNSTEDYSWILDYKNVFYKKNSKNKGPIYARKVGMHLSTGKYISFFDDDDYLIDSTFYTKAIKILEDNDSISFVSANAYELIQSTQAQKKNNILDFYGVVDNVKYFYGFQYKYKKPYSTFTTVFNKKHLINSRILEDGVLNDSSIYLRALTQGPAFFFSDFIGNYRIHDNNISNYIQRDFIFENLIEKYRIGSIFLKNNLNDWFFNQFKLTMDYYVFLSKPSISDIKLIKENLIKQNVNFNRKYKMLLYKYYIYLLIK